MSLFPWALQLWSSSLLVPGAGSCCFPGQGRYPSFSPMTVLVNHTLLKLFFPCSLFPFVAMLRVKDLVPLCVPRQPQIHESAVPCEGPKDARKTRPHLGDTTIPEPSPNKLGLGVFSCKFLEQREATLPSVTGPLSTPEGRPGCRKP